MHVTRRTFLKAALALPLAVAVPLSWHLPAMATPEEKRLERIALAVHTPQGPHRLDVEVADTAPLRQRGLMGRASMEEDHGMLFMYSREQSARSGFWMYQTLIPLDIAFINNAGAIVAIKTMLPCESASSSDCRTYSPGEPYHAALEVNAGYFAERGIRVGDCVAIAGVDGHCVNGVP
ncbi:DUF192 domain-containing protein [Halomonas sp. LS-001]